MSKKPTIAVLGASSNRRKFGNKCVRAFADTGYEVFPINPSEKTIEGFTAYRRLEDVPKPLDCISVYLPPPVSLEYLPDIASAGAGKVWFNPGAADAQVLQAARAAGIHAINGCSVVDIGKSPSQYP